MFHEKIMVFNRRTMVCQSKMMGCSQDNDESSKGERWFVIGKMMVVHRTMMVFNRGMMLCQKKEMVVHRTMMVFNRRMTACSYDGFS